MNEWCARSARALEKLDATRRLAMAPGYVFSFGEAPLSSVRYPVTAITIYLVTIFGLQRAMRDRAPLRLKGITTAHNLLLSGLSALMGTGTLIEVIRVARGAGFGGVICDRGGVAMNGRLGAWMYVFYLSKFYELFDTLILVLRKRPLNFLHYYHHSVVLPLFYVYMRTGMVLQWILVVANSTVHVAMYYYYAMATLGRRVWWKKYITQAQIVQFIIDLTATWPYPFLYFSKTGCSGNMRGWLFGQAVGASFFKLFSDFYSRSYAKAKARAIEAQAGGAQPSSPPAKQIDEKSGEKIL